MRTKKLVAGVLSCAMVFAFGATAYATQTVGAEGADSSVVYNNYSELFNYRTNSDGTVAIDGYKSNHDDIIIPEYIDGNKVTEISGWAFSSNDTAETIEIPSTVTKIGSYAFSHCKKLGSITIPDSVTTLGDGILWDSGVKTVVFGNGIKDIPIFTCYECPQLNTVALPSDVETIGKYTFNDSDIYEITLPSSLKSIGAQAFTGCKSLVTIGIDYNSDVKIDPDAFDGCTSLGSINKQAVVFIDNDGTPKINPNVADYLTKFFDGEDNTLYTNQYVKNACKKIVENITTSDMTDTQKARKIYEWIGENIDYDTINDGHDDHCDMNVFTYHLTVCDGFARAYALLLQSADIEAYYVTGDAFGPGKGYHAWNIVKLGDNYFQCDPTWDDQPAGVEMGSFHFLRSDDYFKEVVGRKYGWGVMYPGELYNRYNGTDGTTPKCLYSQGDLNKDGKIDEADLNKMKDYVWNKVPMNNGDLPLADLNWDGVIDQKDVDILTSEVA